MQDYMNRSRREFIKFEFRDRRAPSKNQNYHSGENFGILAVLLCLMSINFVSFAAFGD